MKVLQVGALVGCMSLPTCSSAGTQDHVKIGLHLQPASKGSLCNVAPMEFACDRPGYSSDFIVSGEADEPYHVFIVVADFYTEHGISEVAIGLESMGNLQSFSWEACSDEVVASEATEWPRNGSWAVFSWDRVNNCQNTPDPSDPQGEGAVVAAGMYVYAYEAAVLKVTPRNSLAEPDLYVVDCDQQVTCLFPSEGYYQGNLGIVGFRELAHLGYSPCSGVGWFTSSDACGGVPVYRSTWGGIKSLYKQ